MTRTEFIKTLHELLAVLPTEERLSAVKYYEEYFEEAGPEQEEAILAELGSPQSIAEMLLRDYSSVPGTAAQVEAARQPAPGEKATATAQQPEQPGQPGSGSTTKDASYSHGNSYKNSYDYNRTAAQSSQRPAYDDRPWYKRIPVWLWVVGGIFLFPVIGAIFGLITSLLGVLGSLLMAVLCLLCAVAIAGVALCIAGVVGLVGGMWGLTINIAGGILTMGIGMALLSLGLLLTLAGITFIRRWMPVAWKWLVDISKRMYSIFKIKDGAGK